MAIAVTDIIYGEEDISIENGDFETNLSDPQHIQHILTSNKGNFYMSPLLGANITQLLKGNASRIEISKLVRSELAKDNYRVIDVGITIDEGGLLIAPTAERIK